MKKRKSMKVFTYPIAHKKLKSDLSGFYARVLKREKKN
jgi:hypothetical protein